MKTIPEAIKERMANGEWFFGGTLEGDVGAMTQHKASIVGRRLREHESGKGSDGKPCEKFLEKRKVTNPKGKGASVVQYRLISSTPPKVLPKYAIEQLGMKLNNFTR